MDIRHCTEEAEIRSVFPAICELYDMSEVDFVRYVQEMQQGEFSLFGAFEEEECIGAVGYRVGRRLYCGRYLHVDNLVVRGKYQKRGIAQALIGFCKKEATRLECDVILADSYVDNKKAQSLFYKEGFYIRGFHLRSDEF